MQRTLLLTAASSLVLAGCLGSSDSTKDTTDYSALPSYLSGTVDVTQVDGSSDDLMTGAALDSDTGAVTPETVTVDASPEQIRRYQLGNNYKSMMDPVTPGGWGTHWGPLVTDGISSHPV